MTSWSLLERDLKRYPHFDGYISASEGFALATDPARVVVHKFYPFIRYVERWNKFADKDASGKIKERPIRYAARRDAYIFSCYRSQLSEYYEVELARRSLGANVLAYRKIPAGDGKGGKCNINFAKDAFDKIKEKRNCIVIALDISSFFECIDHSVLRAIWCRLINKERLPGDHFAVFKAITKYAVVDKIEAYRRLGHYGAKRTLPSGRVIEGYLTPYDKLPQQLCTGKKFRECIAGRGGVSSIIVVNDKDHGIPQGAPISDLLANMYLLEFDTEIRDLIEGSGGHYFRYSDDILCIVDVDETEGKATADIIRSAIRQFGDKLTVKDDKTSIHIFNESIDGQRCRRIAGCRGGDGLEYLGFRYDGRRVLIRDSTLSGLYRKVKRSVRREAEQTVARYPGKCITDLERRFPLEKILKRFGRVEDFKEKSEDYRNWTFWTYTKRAAVLFGKDGKSITSQLARYRRHVVAMKDIELERSLLRRSKLSTTS